MNNGAPVLEQVGNGWTNQWINWFQQVFQCLPWRKAFNVTAVLDFGSIGGQLEGSATVSVTGARQGDGVYVTPSANTAGLIYTGVVTADSVVTIYAKNFTAGAINPASTTFRVIVFQN